MPDSFPGLDLGADDYKPEGSDDSFGLSKFLSKPSPKPYQPFGGQIQQAPQTFAQPQYYEQPQTPAPQSYNVFSDDELDTYERAKKDYGYISRYSSDASAIASKRKSAYDDFKKNKLTPYFEQIGGFGDFDDDDELAAAIDEMEASTLKTSQTEDGFFGPSDEKIAAGESLKNFKLWSSPNGLRDQYRRLRAERDQYQGIADSYKNQKMQRLEQLTNIPIPAREALDEALKSRGKGPGSKKKMNELLDGMSWEQPVVGYDGEVQNLESVDPRAKINPAIGYDGQGNKSSKAQRERVAAAMRGDVRGVLSRRKHIARERQLRDKGFFFSESGLLDGRPIGLSRRDVDLLDIDDMRKAGMTSYQGRPLDEAMAELGGEERLEMAKVMESVYSAKSNYEDAQLAFLKVAGGAGAEKAREKMEAARDDMQKTIGLAAGYGLDNELFEQAETTSWLGGLGNAIKRGMLMSEMSNYTDDFLTNTLDADEMQRFIEIASEIEKLPTSSTMKRVKETKSDGFLDAMGNLLFDNPAAIPEMFVESLSSFLPATIKSMIATVPAGAAAGAAMGGLPGAKIGAAYGARASWGVASFILEASGMALEGMQELNIDWKNPKVFAAAWTNESIRNKIQKKMVQKGVPIAIADTLTGMMAGKVMGVVNHTGNAMFKGGKLLNKEAFNKATGAVPRFTLMQKTRNAAVELGADSTMGMGGEYLGQWASKEPGEDWDWDAIAAEGLIGVGPGALGAALEMRGPRANYFGNAPIEIAGEQQTETGTSGTVTRAGYSAPYQTFNDAESMMGHLASFPGVNPETLEFTQKWVDTMYRIRPEQMSKLKIAVSPRTPDANLKNRGTFESRDGHDIMYLNEQEFAADPLGTFMHESGHFARIMILNDEQLMKIWNDLGEPAQKDAYTQYYTKVPEATFDSLSDSEKKKVERAFKRTDNDILAEEWFSYQWARVLSGYKVDKNIANPLKNFKNKVIHPLLGPYIGSESVAGSTGDKGYVIDQQILDFLGYENGMPDPKTPDSTDAPASSVPESKEAMEAKLKATPGKPADKVKIAKTLNAMAGEKILSTDPSAYTSLTLANMKAAGSESEKLQEKNPEFIQEAEIAFAKDSKKKTARPEFKTTKEREDYTLKALNKTGAKIRTDKLSSVMALVTKSTSMTEAEYTKAVKTLRSVKDKFKTLESLDKAIRDHLVATKKSGKVYTTGGTIASVLDLETLVRLAPTSFIGELEKAMDPTLGKIPNAQDIEDMALEAREQVESKKELIESRIAEIDREIRSLQDGVRENKIEAKKELSDDSKLYTPTPEKELTELKRIRARFSNILELVAPEKLSIDWKDTPHSVLWYRLVEGTVGKEDRKYLSEPRRLTLGMMADAADRNTFSKRGIEVYSSEKDAQNDKPRKSNIALTPQEELWDFVNGGFDEKQSPPGIDSRYGVEYNAMFNDRRNRNLDGYKLILEAVKASAMFPKQTKIGSKSMGRARYSKDSQGNNIEARKGYPSGYTTDRGASLAAIIAERIRQKKLTGVKKKGSEEKAYLSIDLVSDDPTLEEVLGLAMANGRTLELLGDPSDSMKDFDQAMFIIAREKMKSEMVARTYPKGLGWAKQPKVDYSESTIDRPSFLDGEQLPNRSKPSKSKADIEPINKPFQGSKKDTVRKQPGVLAKVEGQETDYAEQAGDPWPKVQGSAPLSKTLAGIVSTKARIKFHNDYVNNEVESVQSAINGFATSDLAVPNQSLERRELKEGDPQEVTKKVYRKDGSMGSDEAKILEMPLSEKTVLETKPKLVGKAPQVALEELSNFIDKVEGNPLYPEAFIDFLKDRRMALFVNLSEAKKGKEQLEENIKKLDSSKNSEEALALLQEIAEAGDPELANKMYLPGFNIKPEKNYNYRRPLERTSEKIAATSEHDGFTVSKIYETFDVMSAFAAGREKDRKAYGLGWQRDYKKFDKEQTNIGKSETMPDRPIEMSRKDADLLSSVDINAVDFANWYIKGKNPEEQMRALQNLPSSQSSKDGKTLLQLPGGLGEGLLPYVFMDFAKSMYEKLNITGFESKVEGARKESAKDQYALIKDKDRYEKKKSGIISGDLWQQDGIKVVSTNLGGVHGRGLAKQAKDKGFITSKNIDFDSSPLDKGVITLAVKGEAPETQKVKGKAFSEQVSGKNIDLLKRELRKLIRFARQNKNKKIYLPMVGLGFGEGDANVIMPLLETTAKESNIFLIGKDSSTVDRYASSFVPGVRRDATSRSETRYALLEDTEMSKFKWNFERGELLFNGKPAQFDAFLDKEKRLDPKAMAVLGKPIVQAVLDAEAIDVYRQTDPYAENMLQRDTQKGGAKEDNSADMRDDSGNEDTQVAKSPKGQLDSGTSQFDSTFIKKGDLKMRDDLQKLAMAEFKENPEILERLSYEQLTELAKEDMGPVTEILQKELERRAERKSMGVSFSPDGKAKILNSDAKILTSDADPNLSKLGILARIAGGKDGERAEEFQKWMDAKKDSVKEGSFKMNMMDRLSPTKVLSESALKKFEKLGLKKGSKLHDFLNVHGRSHQYFGKGGDGLEQSRLRFYDPLIELMRKHSVSQRTIGEYLIARSAPSKNLQIEIRGREILDEIAKDEKNGTDSARYKEYAKFYLDKDGNFVRNSGVETKKALEVMAEMESDPKFVKFLEEFLPIYYSMNKNSLNQLQEGGMLMVETKGGKKDKIQTVDERVAMIKASSRFDFNTGKPDKYGNSYKSKVTLEDDYSYSPLQGFDGETEQFFDQEQAWEDFGSKGGGAGKGFDQPKGTFILTGMFGRRDDGVKSYGPNPDTLLGNAINQHTSAMIRAQKNEVSNSFGNMYSLLYSVLNPNKDIKEESSEFFDLNNLVDPELKEAYDILKTIHNEENKELLKELRDEFNSVFDKPFEASETKMAYELQKDDLGLADAKIGIVRRTLSNTFKNDPVVFTFRRGGQPYFIRFNSRTNEGLRMADAMKNLRYEAMPPILGGFNVGTRLMAKMFTSANLAFILPNFFRDVLTARIHLGEDHKKVLIKDALNHKNLAGFMKAIYQAEADIKKGVNPNTQAEIDRILDLGDPKKILASGNRKAMYQYYKSQGGKVDMFRHLTLVEKVKEIQKSLKGKDGWTKKSWKNFWDFIDTANTAVENSIRASTFWSAIKNGRSPDEAAVIARNVTVDFNQKGNLTQAFGSLYVFFGASMNSIDRFFTTFARRTPEERLKLIAAIAGGAFVLNLLNRLLDDDEEEEMPDYDTISSYKRDTNAIIPLPAGLPEFFNDEKDTGYFSLPLPLGYNLFWTLGQVMGDMFAKNVMGRGGTGLVGATTRFTDSALSAFNPIGGSSGLAVALTPTPFTPMIELYANKNFMGAPIRYDDQPFEVPKPGHMQDPKSTPEHWNKLSKAINKFLGGSDVVKGSLAGSVGSNPLLYKSDEDIKFDMSGNQMRHLVMGYLGGPGQMADALFGSLFSLGSGESTIKSVNNIPVVNRFLRSTTYGTATRDTFYELRNAIKTAEAAVKKAKEISPQAYSSVLKDNKSLLQLSSQISALDKQKNKLRRLRNKIEGSKALSEEQKTQRVDEIQKKELNLMVAVIKKAQSLGIS